MSLRRATRDPERALPISGSSDAAGSKAEPGQLQSGDGQASHIASLPNRDVVPSQEVQHPVHALLAPHIPYTVTLVELEEGVRFVSGIPQGMKVDLRQLIR